MPPAMLCFTIHYVTCIVFIMQHCRPLPRVQSFSMVLWSSTYVRGKNACPQGTHHTTSHCIEFNHITSHHTTSDCMCRLTLFKDNYSSHMLCCWQCVRTKQNTYNTCTHGIHTSCGIPNFTHYFAFQCVHTHCVSCVHACMHTNILEPKCLRSSLQHHCMHSNINQAEVNCSITCQYKQNSGT
jgi:hypothetical protein